eukprot:g6763.t1
MTLFSLFPNGFLSFLPLDNETVENVDSAMVMEALSEDLALVLRLTDNDFWKLVSTETSLLTSLDSFLRFRRRGFDEVVESSVIAKTLEQRVLLVFLRLVTVPEKFDASNRQKQADRIYDNWIIDIPKLLDLCCLYREQSPLILQELLTRTFNLQPKYLYDLKDMVSTLAENLTIFEDRCKEALVQVEQGDEMGLVGWNDVFSYMLDVCVNLSAFAELYPPGAAQLLHSKGILLTILTEFHDLFLPRFDQVMRKAVKSGFADLEDFLKLKCILMVALQKTVFLLLKSAYLSGDCDQPHVAGDNGQQLMTVIMSCAVDDGVGSTGQLISKANDRFHLFDLMIQSIDKGRIVLDDAQFDYLSMLFSTNRRPQSLKPVSKSLAIIKVDTPVHSSDVDKATVLSKINQIKDILPDYGDGFLQCCLFEYNQDPEQVIAHLLEDSLPPNLTCLDPQMPLNDGSYRGARIVQTGASASSAGPSNYHQENGASSSSQQLLPDVIGLGWDVSEPEKKVESDIKHWAEVKIGPAEKQQQSQQKQKKKKKRIDKRTARILDESSSDIRQMIIQQANELLIDEYEDEFDDSFTEFGASGADSLADIEGDDKFNNKGKEWNDAKKSKKPYYVKDGKIYNAPVEGAVAYRGQENAQQAARQRDNEIYGLGPGGNVPESSERTSTPASTNRGRGRGQQRSRGRGGQRGRGRSHFQKERNLRKHQF